MTKYEQYVRCLTVSEETLLLLELLDLLFVGRLSDELIDVEKIALCGNIKASILLPNAISSEERRMRP